jgi:hypothetical protein
MPQRLTPKLHLKAEGWFYLIALVALLPTLVLRDFTPANELRYLSIADEALRQHHLFAFSNHGTPYADKPPFYFWMIMACRCLTGAHRMWLLSLFSLLPALAMVRIMDRWTASVIQPAYRCASRLVLLTCAYYLGSAVTLRMDMLMSLFILLALRSFWRMHTQPDAVRREAWLFPVYLFLALFTKGPLGVLIPLCGTTVYLALTGGLRRLGRSWGWRTWFVLLMGCGLWFGATYLEGGGKYLHNLLFHQTVDRAIHSFHHDKPWYFYLLSSWYSFAPWAPLLVVGLVVALRGVRRRLLLHQYFLSVGVSTFLLLSCISSKLEVYLLPAYPFLVYAALWALQDYSRAFGIRLSLTLPASIFALAFPAFVVTTRHLDLLDTPLLYVASGALSLSGVYALVALYAAPKWLLAAAPTHSGALSHRALWSMRSLGFGFLIVLFIGGWSLPQLNEELGYRALCRQAQFEAQEHHIQDVHTWRLSNAEDMDIYLNNTVHVIPKSDNPAADSLHNYLLLTPKEHIALYPDCEAQVMGPYAIIVYQPSPNPIEAHNSRH